MNAWKLTLCTLLAILYASAAPVSAQSEIYVESADTVCTAVQRAVIDSLCIGKNVLDMVKVSQSQAITDSMSVNILRNSFGQAKGYRVRIYFSNAQNAREESAATELKFKENFPEHAAYRSFVSPNFKVTVGDFLSKSEALVLKAAISAQFPAAFVVKEDINLTN